MSEAKPERKQIEMSIWFVVLLIAVIIFMCVFMSMKTKLDAANETIATQTVEIEKLNKQNSERADIVLDLRKQATDGDLSMRALIAKLDEMGFQVTTNNEIKPADSVATSGDVVTSGEVAK